MRLPWRRRPPDKRVEKRILYFAMIQRRRALLHFVDFVLRENPKTGRMEVAGRGLTRQIVDQAVDQIAGSVG